MQHFRSVFTLFNEGKGVSLLFINAECSFENVIGTLLFHWWGFTTLGLTYNALHCLPSVQNMFLVDSVVSLSGFHNGNEQTWPFLCHVFILSRISVRPLLVSWSWLSYWCKKRCNAHADIDTSTSWTEIVLKSQTDPTWKALMNGRCLLDNTVYLIQASSHWVNVIMCSKLWVVKTYDPLPLWL